MVSIDEIKEKINLISVNEDTSQEILRLLCNSLEAVQGAFYSVENSKIKLIETYAYYKSDTEEVEYEIGEGLVGQVAKDKKFILLTDVPEGYMTVVSGLGKSSPDSLLVYPLQKKDTVSYIFELAFFNANSKMVAFLNELSQTLIAKLDGSGR